MNDHAANESSRIFPARHSGGNVTHITCTGLFRKEPIP